MYSSTSTHGSFLRNGHREQFYDLQTELHTQSYSFRSVRLEIHLLCSDIWLRPSDCLSHPTVLQIYAKFSATSVFLSISNMSSLLEECNNLFANVPLLSEDQYHLLFQLDRHLFKAGIQTNLSLVAREQIFLTDKSSAVSAEDVSGSQVRFTCTHNSPNGVICLSCDELTRKEKRWSMLFEAYKDKIRYPYIPCVSCLEPGCHIPFGHSHPWDNHAARQAKRHVDETVSIDALTSPQVSEWQTSQPMSADNSAPNTSPTGSRSTNSAQSVLQSSSEKAFDRGCHTISQTRHTATHEGQAVLTPGRIAPPNSPAHYPQTDTLQNETVEGESRYRVHWPSVSFLSQHNKVQFPEISYFLEDNMKLSGLEPPEAIARVDDSSQHNEGKSFDYSDLQYSYLLRYLVWIGRLTF